jgi:Holliday junction DNA helicase RuvA
MIMLSSLSPTEIAQAIVNEDVRIIQSVKGIGTKTAQRVIIELQDKMRHFSLSEENLSSSNNTNKFDALIALASLGFDKKAAERALDKIYDENDSVENLIKHALKVL